MTTQNPYEGITDDEIADIVQEAENELRHSEAEGGLDGQNPPQEDPFSAAARKITSPEESAPDVVDKDYLARQFDYFRQQVSEDVRSAVANSQATPVEEDTPDVEALVNLLYAEDPTEPPTAEEVAAAKARFIAFKQAAVNKQEERSIPEVLNEIRDKVNRLEQNQAAPQRQQGWNQEDERHVIQAINYAAVGTGLQIDYNDPVQMGAVMSGVIAGEPVEAAIRKIHTNIGQIGSRVNQAPGVISPQGAASIPSLDSIPTSQDEIIIRSEEEFHEKVADGVVSVSDYPYYASNW